MQYRMEVHTCYVVVNIIMCMSTIKSSKKNVIKYYTIASSVRKSLHCYSMHWQFCVKWCGIQVPDHYLLVGKLLVFMGIQYLSSSARAFNSVASECVAQRKC